MGRAATGVLVAIPWAGTCPHRIAALAWVLKRWRAAGHDPALGRLPDGQPWVKARAVASVIEPRTEPVVVVADADVWSPGVGEAIERVRNGAPWATPHGCLHRKAPHGRLHRLSPAATSDVLAGAEPHVGMALAEGGRPYPGRTGGGIVVLRRDVWEDCPLDPRFQGWGQEDEAWAMALTVLHGPPVKGEHPMWHLWHPPQERMNRGIGSTESLDLYKRYAAARTPEQMRALVEEVRRC